MYTPPVWFSESGFPRGHAIHFHVSSSECSTNLQQPRRVIPQENRPRCWLHRVDSPERAIALAGRVIICIKGYNKRYIILGDGFGYVYVQPLLGDDWKHPLLLFVQWVENTSNIMIR